MNALQTNGIGKTFTAWLCIAGLLAPVAPAFASPFTWQYGYDAMGRLTTALDPNGLATYTYYDSLGRPIQTQQPANTGSATPTTIGFAYNARDDLTQVSDPRNLATSYSPNGLGNVTAQTSPDTGASQYTYDLNGNVLTKTDARGKLTQYTYDVLDRLTRAHYATGVDSVFEYSGGSTPILQKYLARRHPIRIRSDWGSSALTSASRVRCLMLRAGCSRTGTGSTAHDADDICSQTLSERLGASTTSPMFRVIHCGQAIQRGFTRAIGCSEP